MNITSHPVSPIQPIGSNVTLTCIVELSPAVDIPVTVNTVCTGPAGFNISNTAQPVINSNTTYVSTAVVRPFERDQSGNYTCRATVSLAFMSFATSSSKSITLLKLTSGKSSNNCYDVHTTIILFCFVISSTSKF